MHPKIKCSNVPFIFSQRNKSQINSMSRTSFICISTNRPIRQVLDNEILSLSCLVFSAILYRRTLYIFQYVFKSTSECPIKSNGIISIEKKTLNVESMHFVAKKYPNINLLAKGLKEELLQI